MLDKVQLRHTIDHLNHTPKYLYNSHFVLSKDECVLLAGGKRTSYDIAYMHKGTASYCKKLCTYLERFGTHMPEPLRKALLYEVYDL